MVILIVDKNHSYDLLVSARPGSASHCAHLTCPGTLSPLIAEKHCENPSGGTTFFFVFCHSQAGPATQPECTWIAKEMWKGTPKPLLQVA